MPKTRKIILITGCGGLSTAVAKKFATEGDIVIFLARNKKTLAEARNRITEIGECFAYQLNVTDEQRTKKIIAAIYKKFKSIDVLVNAAGILGPVGPFHGNSFSDWKEALNINLVGTACVCHAVLPFMVKKKAGSIINFSGGGSVQPMPNFSSYAASKAAIVRLTENLAREYATYGICVNAVAPGVIKTAFMKNTLAAGPKKAGKDYYEKMVAQNKIGGDSPDLAADLVFFLSSDTSHGLTGKLISAKWDPWKKFTAEEVVRINANSEYALRRIDNQFFYEKK